MINHVSGFTQTSKVRQDRELIANACSAAICACAQQQQMLHALPPDTYSDSCDVILKNCLQNLHVFHRHPEGTTQQVSAVCGF